MKSLGTAKNDTLCQEDLVVIKFTEKGPSIGKESKGRGFSRGLLILFYYKGRGL